MHETNKRLKCTMYSTYKYILGLNSLHVHSNLYSFDSLMNFLKFPNNLFCKNETHLDSNTVAI